MRKEDEKSKKRKRVEKENKDAGTERMGRGGRTSKSRRSIDGESTRGNEG